MINNFFDPKTRFSINVIGCISNPQTIIYQAMHQCYSSDDVSVVNMSESECGKAAVKRLLKGNKGHFGCIEHPQIVINANYTHTVLQQLRTHRIGVSFDVQSFRYTELANVTLDNIEDVVYLRPNGEYTSRDGKYYYSGYERQKKYVYTSIKKYRELIAEGVAPEHAREILPYCVRQKFVMSGNLRTLLHIVDLRSKPNTQLETMMFSDALFGLLLQWCPEICGWYKEHRYKKARLSP